MSDWRSPYTGGTGAYTHFSTASLQALKTLQLQPGLEAVLEQCARDGARLAVVTRNTTRAVDAFFGLLGAGWRGRFSTVLTREFQFVKPDRRLLLHVAAQWELHPSQLLMVGDSKEDVEVGALVGASTCLIAGGGNDPFGAACGPDEICPTFKVSSMPQLGEVLRSEEAAVAAAAPPGLPPGVAFIDALVADRTLPVADCSYPWHAAPPPLSGRRRRAATLLRSPGS